MSFFEGLWQIITSVWQAVGHFLESLVLFLMVVQDSTTLPFSYIGFLPSIIGSCVLAVISVAVVKLIIGR